MKKLLVVLLSFSLYACQSAYDGAYYAVWEKMGVEKRDILVDRVEEARESQEDAQEQFTSALDEFSQLINFDGGELQDVYEDLNSRFEASQEAASDVTNRIDRVERVAQALFDEWNEELEKFSNQSLKRDSQRQLRETQRRYDSLISAMRKAESKMPPVLSALQDNVLYLKHNLNASAVGALQGEFNVIKKDIDLLIKDMNSAIAQSNEFIEKIKS